MMVAVCDPNPELFSNLEARRSITIETQSACFFKPTVAAELFPPPLANTDEEDPFGLYPGHTKCVKPKLGTLQDHI